MFLRLYNYLIGGQMDGTKRKVEVLERKYSSNSDGFVETPKQGNFHRWGIRQHRAKPGEQPTMQTVGIIEYADGKIVQAYPESIRFLEPLEV